MAEIKDIVIKFCILHPVVILKVSKERQAIIIRNL